MIIENALYKIGDITHVNIYIIWRPWIFYSEFKVRFNI